MDQWKGKFATPDGLIPLVGRKRHSPGAGTFNHATATSGVKVAQHPQGLTLTPAQGGGARWRWATRLISYVVVIDTHVRFRGEAPRNPRVLGKHVCPFRAGCWLGYPFRKSYPNVLVMQPSQDRNGTMAPDRWTARCKGASFCNAKCVRARL